MVYVSLGYIPGHIHAFWLIYKKMAAEERYGHGGFLCEIITLIFVLLSSVLMLISNKDIGNGQYQPLYSDGPAPHAPAPSYGATGR